MVTALAKKRYFAHLVEIKCPNCGQKAKPTDKFCGECGTTLPQIIEENEEEIKVCPACGSVCNSGGQFCENCGSAL